MPGLSSAALAWGRGEERRKRLKEIVMTEHVLYGHASTLVLENCALAPRTEQEKRFFLHFSSNSLTDLH